MTASTAAVLCLGNPTILHMYLFIDPAQPWSVFGHTIVPLSTHRNPPYNTLSRYDL